MTLFLTRWIKIGSRSTFPSSCLCFRSSLDIRFLELLVDILIRTTVSHFTESLHDYWMGWIIILPCISDWLINSLAFTNQRRPALTHIQNHFSNNNNMYTRHLFSRKEFSTCSTGVPYSYVVAAAATIAGCYIVRAQCVCNKYKWYEKMLLYIVFWVDKGNER